MTIYKDGEEQESINLHEIDDKDALHALFREKGFVQRSTQQVGQEEGDNNKQQQQITDVLENNEEEGGKQKHHINQEKTEL